jgi:hypothetical protein
LLARFWIACCAVASVAVPHATGVNQQAVAAQENVDVFHRFALMRHWHDIDGMPFEAFLSRDGLHMNDWSYNCFAKALADAIANAATPRENSNASANATTGETR